MPKTNKPIVLICGSRDINDIQLSRYIDASTIGQVVHGGATGVDTLAESWAKNNNIETIIFEPNYEIYGRKAPIVRDKEMVEYADYIIGFWNGRSRGTNFTLNYARELGKKYFIHLIEN